MLWYALRERDTIIDLFEMSTGQRMHTRYFQVGGVFEDIPVGFERKLRAFCAGDRSDRPVRGALSSIATRSSFGGRRGSGSSRASGCSSSGSLGPCCEPPASQADLRKADPYLAYGEVDFKIPIGTVGDGYDRYRVRMQEMRESVRIIEQCTDGSGGPWIVDDRKVVLPPRHELLDPDGGSDPPLQARHRGLPCAAGRGLLPIESPRGELGCYLLADGSAKPAGALPRPSFVNLQSLREMSIGGYVADLIQNLGMLDPILGGG